MELLSDSILDDFVNQSTVRLIAAIPPKDAFYYFPNENDLIDIDLLNRKRSVRRIFEGPTIYTDFEIEQINLFRFEFEYYRSDENSSVDDVICLRYLQASLFDYSKAFEIIIDHIEWRKTNFDLTLTHKNKEILNSGFI